MSDQEGKQSTALGAKLEYSSTGILEEEMHSV